MCLLILRSFSYVWNTPNCSDISLNFHRNTTNSKVQHNDCVNFTIIHNCDCNRLRFPLVFVWVLQSTERPRSWSVNVPSAPCTPWHFVWFRSKFLWICTVHYRMLFCVLFDINILHLIHLVRIEFKFLYNSPLTFRFAHRRECMLISCWLDCILASRLTVYTKTETRSNPGGRFSRLSSEIAHLSSCW